MEQKFSELINTVKEGNNNNNFKNKIEKKSSQLILGKNKNLKNKIKFYKIKYINKSDYKILKLNDKK